MNGRAFILQPALSQKKLRFLEEFKIASSNENLND
jgi:hypothetical protein